ncbi:acylphosphatase [Flavihumibacter sp. R14]|nr:acylphosphatase [Flavihumibacter soli]
MKHLDIRVSGKVQGVFYRATTKAVADQLGVKGVVLNDEDGSVFIEAEGDDFALEMLLEFCHKGSDRAEVEKVEVSESELKNYRNFEVIRRKLN